MSINISPNFIRGFAIVTGAYVVHRVLKAAYRRGFERKPCKKSEKASRYDG